MIYIYVDIDMDIDIDIQIDDIDTDIDRPSSRSAQLPRNYYGLQGVTHQHLSDHLSEVVENTVEGLERFGCCSIEDGLGICSIDYMVEVYDIL